MKDRNWIHLVPFIIGAVVAYALTSLSPAEGSTNYLYVFFAGVIAISALVLPGISGSFILLLLGLYTIIIPTIKSFLKSPELSEFMMLGVFGLGCLTGLIVFSRIVSAAFEKFHDGTIAIMSGFMLGSLNKIWPWRNPELVLNKDTGAKTIIDANNISSFNASEEAIKILDEANVMPEGYYGNPRVGLVLAAFVIGLILIYLLYLSQSKKSKK